MDDALIWGLVLLALGGLLLIVEVFVVSGGLIAVLSAGCAIVGIAFLFRYDTTWGLMGLIGALVVGPAGMLYGLSMWRHTPIGRRLIGVTGKEGAEEQAKREDQQQSLRSLAGSEGEAVTDLRPVGVIRIGTDRYDATSETGLVRAGGRVRVTGVDGASLRVRPLE